MLILFFSMIRRPTSPTRTTNLLPYTTLFRDQPRWRTPQKRNGRAGHVRSGWSSYGSASEEAAALPQASLLGLSVLAFANVLRCRFGAFHDRIGRGDRKSTRLNSSH